MRRLVALLLCACAFPAFATDSGDLAAKGRAFAADAMKTWASDPSLIEAVVTQNQRHAALSPDDIDALDKTWGAELGTSVQPTISSVLINAPSDLLRAQVEQSAGLMTEVFVMDQLGLNVASATPTSDYWQGDEDKFSQTYPVGAGAIHISEVEFDDSSQTYQVQVSFTLVHPTDGTPIGAVTVGLNAELL